jgi:hypothetical protein
MSASEAQASENGGSAYPYGAEGLAVAALPPPGTYLLNYSNYYRADRLNGSDGMEAGPPDFSIDAAASVFRLVHVTPVKIAGATLAMQAFVPVVDLTVHAGGARGHAFGVGDLIVNPFILGWQKGQWHIVATVDTFVPVGSYDPKKLANLGRNYWTFQPVLAITNAGAKVGPDFSVKLMYDINTRNGKTRYRSGNEVHADFAVGYNFQKVAVGINGYYAKQVRDDKLNGVKVGDHGYRGEVFALGPTIKYQAGRVPISFQWQHEFDAENRPQGNKFWLKTAFRF